MLTLIFRPCNLKMTMERTTGETTEAGPGEESNGKIDTENIRDEVMEEKSPVQVSACEMATVSS